LTAHTEKKEMLKKRLENEEGHPEARRIKMAIPVTLVKKKEYVAVELHSFLTFVIK
jgi:hypothetical protein